MGGKGHRIGLVRRGYSPTGGAEKYLQRFAATLADRGHQPVLFTTNAWPGEDAEAFTSVHRLPDGGPLAFADALKELKPREHCDTLFSLERVWECDFYRAGDGVHRAWLDRRSVYEPWIRPRLRSFNRKHQQILELERALFSPEASTTVIANAEFVRHELIQYHDMPWDRVKVVHNGHKPPPVKDDARTRIRERLGLGSRDVLLLFTGSGWERKGLKFAIQAAARLESEKVVLAVAGRGRTAGLPNGPVRYLGPVEEMAELYEAADIFILPTIYDPFSNASLEAAAHGLPVITTTANGFSEIMLHGHQGETLEDPSNLEHLTEAIRRWLDPAKREQSRDTIRRWARQYSIKRNVEETLHILFA